MLGSRYLINQGDRTKCLEGVNCLRAELDLFMLDLSILQGDNTGRELLTEVCPWTKQQRIVLWLSSQDGRHAAFWK